MQARFDDEQEMEDEEEENKLINEVRMRVTTIDISLTRATTRRSTRLGKTDLIYGIDCILTRRFRKKNAPYLYDLIITHALDWPSLTCQWFPDKDQYVYATCFATYI